MKKTLIGFLATLGCLACLAGCGAPKNTGLSSARDYVKELYKNEATETGADFERAGFVTIDGVSYEVVWSVDVSEGVIVTKNEVGDYVIDVDENAEEALNYVLTATIKDAKGNTETLTYNHTVPKFRELTWAEFVAAEDDTAVVIKGVIGGIVNTDSKHELYLQDNDGGYYVYNLAVAEMEGLQIGTEIRVRGTRDTYYGVNQVVNADVEILNADPVAVVAEDITEAFVNAESTKDKALVALQSKLIKITGAVVLGQDASDSSYYNFKIGDKKTYVRISSSACMFGTEDQEAFKDAVAANIGKTAVVTGFISVYNNAVYIIPQTKDAFSNFELLDLSEAEKIDFELDLMAGVASKLTSNATLQTKGSIYEDVAITWTSNNETVAKVENGTLVVTRPARDAADVTVKLTASVACGEAAAKTVEYEVLIPKMPSTVPVAITAAPVVNTTYKMYMDHTDLEKHLFLIGVMDSYYIATTEAQEEAANVTVKAGSAEGKFYLQVAGAGYLNITVAEKTAGDPSKGYYYNISFDREAKTDWVWDDTHKTLVTDEADEARRCFLGTQGSKKFTTISSSAYKYIGSNIHANLCTLEDAANVPDEPTTPDPDTNVDPNAEKIVTNPAVATAYNIYMYQGNKKAVAYLKGGMDGHYLATSSNANEALNFFLEATDGGYYLFYLDGTTKTYLNIVKSGNYTNGKYETTPSTVYTFDTTYNTLVNAEGYFFGTRGDDTYTTMGPCANGFIDENFLAHFIPAVTAHEHSCTEAVTDPTCTEAGYTTYTCACGHTYTEAGEAATGHSYNEVVTAPTCTVDGYTTHTCANCNDSYTDSVVTAEGHKYVEGKCSCGADDPNYEAHVHNYTPEVTAPTCTEKGYTTYTCTCEDTYTADEVPATGHSYNEVVTDPTCTAAGYTTFTCKNTNCNDTYTGNPVDATGHADTDADYKCNGNGCSEVLAPEADSELTIAQAIKLGKAFAHNTYTAGKYYVVGVINEVYDTTHGNMYVKDADGNKLQVYGTYSADGSTKYGSMSTKPVAGDTVTLYGIIGTYNSSQQMKNGWIVEHTAHEHDYVSNVTEPTCTADGYTTHTCSICKDSYKDTEVEATGHSYVEGVCSVCGAQEGAVAQYVKVTSAEEFTTGTYILVVNTKNITLSTIDGSWIKGSELTADKVSADNVIEKAFGDTLAITLEVSDDGVKIKIGDTYIKPSGGNNNGIATGDYTWAYEFQTDDTIIFKGTGSDTVTLAYNVQNAGFRGYKNATVTGTNASSYPCKFTAYKLVG